MSDAALVVNAGRPVSDQGRGDAAFVDPVLVEPERCVGQIGPGWTVALIGILGARHQLGVVAELHGFTAAGVRARNHQLVHQDIDR